MDPVLVSSVGAMLAALIATVVLLRIAHRSGRMLGYVAASVVSTGIVVLAARVAIGMIGGTTTV